MRGNGTFALGPIKTTPKEAVQPPPNHSGGGAASVAAQRGRSLRRRSRATGAAVAGRVALQFFGSPQTQTPLGLEQAIRQDWHHVKLDQHRMLRLRKSYPPSPRTT